MFRTVLRNAPPWFYVLVVLGIFYVIAMFYPSCLRAQEASPVQVEAGGLVTPELLLTPDLTRERVIAFVNVGRADSTLRAHFIAIPISVQPTDGSATTNLVILQAGAAWALESPDKSARVIQILRAGGTFVFTGSSFSPSAEYVIAGSVGRFSFFAVNDLSLLTATDESGKTVRSLVHHYEARVLAQPFRSVDLHVGAFADKVAGYGPTLKVGPVHFQLGLDCFGGGRCSPNSFMTGFTIAY